MQEKGYECRECESTVKFKIKRRGFINFLIGGSLTAFFTSILYPVIKYLTPLVEPKAALGEWKKIVPVEDIPLKKGKKVIYANKPLWIIQSSPNDYRAVSAICTHLGCIVEWKEELQHFVCPCHDGHFNSNAFVVAGPPPRPLPLYNIEIKERNIYIGGLKEGERLYGV